MWIVPKTSLIGIGHLKSIFQYWQAMDFAGNLGMQETRMAQRFPRPVRTLYVSKIHLTFAKITIYMCAQKETQIEALPFGACVLTLEINRNDWATADRGLPTGQRPFRSVSNRRANFKERRAGTPQPSWAGWCKQLPCLRCLVGPSCPITVKIICGVVWQSKRKKSLIS